MESGASDWGSLHKSYYGIMGSMPILEVAACKFQHIRLRALKSLYPTRRGPTL